MSLCSLQPVPVEPGGLIILIPRIIVATLGVHKLVAGAEHRSSVRKHQDREEILDLLLAQLHYFRGNLQIALPSAVPAQIVVGSIVVVLTVGEVVLRVVSDQIIEAKTVVGSHVVNRLVGVVSIVEVIGKQVTTAINPAHQIPDLARIAFNERANVVVEICRSTGSMTCRESCVPIRNWPGPTLPRCGEPLQIPHRW